MQPRIQVIHPDHVSFVQALCLMREKDSRRVPNTAMGLVSGSEGGPCGQAQYRCNESGVAQTADAGSQRSRN